MTKSLRYARQVAESFGGPVVDLIVRANRYEGGRLTAGALVATEHMLIFARKSWATNATVTTPLHHIEHVAMDVKPLREPRLVIVASATKAEFGGSHPEVENAVMWLSMRGWKP